jgi:hypothetical protein
MLHSIGELRHRLTEGPFVPWSVGQAQKEDLLPADDSDELVASMLRSGRTPHSKHKCYRRLTVLFVRPCPVETISPFACHSKAHAWLPVRPPPLPCRYIERGTAETFDRVAQMLQDRLGPQKFQEYLAMQLQLPETLPPAMRLRLRLLSKIPFRGES